MRQRMGLRPPRSVVAATESYFRAEDTIGRWIDERCQRGPERKGLPLQFYSDFLGWLQRVGETWRPSLKEFSQKLDEVPGLERGWVGLGKDADGRRQESPKGFIGIALRQAEAELPFDDPLAKRRTGGDWQLPDDPAERWGRE